jgi:hypothetical protein
VCGITMVVSEEGRPRRSENNSLRVDRRSLNCGTLHGPHKAVQHHSFSLTPSAVSIPHGSPHYDRVMTTL